MKKENTNDKKVKETTKALSDPKSVELSKAEKIEIERTFEEASSFRKIGEKITAPIDSIISETTKVIEKDPIMKLSKELSEMNSKIQWVYDDIIDNDWVIMKTLKSIPLVWNLAKALDKRVDEARFNMKSIEWKIASIFSWFDQSYNSVNKSIKIQEDFLVWIDENIGKIISYKEFLDEKIKEFSYRLEDAQNEKEEQKLSLFIKNVEYFQWNLIVLIWNLAMARKRLLIRLDSANKLSLAMNSSKPVFKTLLSTAIIENSSQKAIEASLKTMKSMWKTIDKMSSTLTDKAIDTNRKTEELTSKPVLSATNFIENVTKLKNHFDEIESYRKQVKEEAMGEKKLFLEAEKNLEKIVSLNTSDYKEFEEELEDELEEI